MKFFGRLSCAKYELQPVNFCELKRYTNPPPTLKLHVFLSEEAITGTKSGLLLPTSSVRESWGKGKTSRGFCWQVWLWLRWKLLDFLFCGFFRFQAMVSLE